MEGERRPLFEAYVVVEGKMLTVEVEEVFFHGHSI